MAPVKIDIKLVEVVGKGLAILRASLLSRVLILDFFFLTFGGLRPDIIVFLESFKYHSLRYVGVGVDAMAVVMCAYRLAT